MRLIVLFLFTMEFAGFSQQWDWVKNYGESPYEMANAFGLDKNENMYVIKLTYKDSPDYRDQLLKIDKNGNLVWKETLPYHGAGIVTTIEGECYVYSQSILSKYSKDGILLWTNIDSSIVYRSVEIFPNGGVVACGGTYNEKAKVVRYDGNGNKQWELLRDYFFNAMGNVSVDSGGNTYYSGGYKKDTSTYNKGAVFKINPAGNIESFFSIPTEGRIRVSHDGILLIRAGGPFEAENGIEPDDYTQHLIKYDFAGNISWHKKFTTSRYGPYLTSLTEDNDQNLFVAGNFMWHLYFDNQEYFSNQDQMFIAKFDKTGAFQGILISAGDHGDAQCTQMNAGSNTVYFAGGVVANKDFGDFHISTQDVQNDVLVGRISNTSLQSISEYSERISTFIIYPNPSGSIFSIEATGKMSIKEIIMYSMSGATVFSQTYTASTQSKVVLNLRGISKGSYLVQIKSESSTETKRVIVE